MSLLSTHEDLEIAPIAPNSYAGWQASGIAFRKGPASGKEITTLEIRNSRTKAVISSEREGDAPTGTLTSPPFTVTNSHISFRIGGGSYPEGTCAKLLVGGKTVRSSTGNRSDFLVPANWNVSEFRGKMAQIQVVDQESGDWGHINIDKFMQTDNPEKTIEDQALYQEELRPQFHVTARYWDKKKIGPVEHEEGWINDLNGLIYYEGEYHMFAQRWATCWLHFVSKDLVHWTELKPAFFEESHRSGVQSGTCVIDYKNTSGLSGDPKTPPMLAFWSRFDNRSQCLHYSLDKGRTWQPYPKNPFMTKPERDPKVFWYEPGGHWVMVMYGEGAYHVLNSTNLLDWTDTGHPIPDSFECPDMFELAVDGNSANKKWVLIQGSGQYSYGRFDGKEFKEESLRLACDIGPNFYATQSWHNTDTGDGRRIQAAWMRGSVFPNMPFSQQVSFPCELSLKTTPAGLRLFRKPIKELDLLHADSSKRGPETVEAGATLALASRGQLWRIRCGLSIEAGSRLEFTIGGQKVMVERHLISNGVAQAVTVRPIEQVEILADRGSIEVYVNDGEVSSTRFALQDGEGVSLTAVGGPVRLTGLEINALKSIWPK